MYALNHDELRPIYEWIKPFEQHWDRQLDRIRTRAERRAAELSRASDRTNRKKGTT